MAQSTSRGGGGRYVGDYVVGRQIGSGSFSVVWHARHKVHGTEVAIKEIHMGRLNKKLQESLMSEIVILKQTNHPNVIRLHDIIEETGRIHLVLEYCRGGDLSIYIQQRQGRVPEATAKYFMQQLAAGLQILRDNNIIHRDLKPQNLLLSTNTDNAVLKIADFGFARSLQPRGLAETLCGSPLYMAPEIMRLQKYDAKADLWSVGAILFQLVTGKTPFTGNNQIQLLQNIMQSTELQFPPNKKDLSSDCLDLCQKLLRRNPVERLTFEEFFNHPFLSLRQSDQFLRNSSPRTIDGFSLSESNPVRNEEESSQDDCLPFILDDDSRGPDGSPSFVRRPSMKSTYGFSLDTKVDRKEVFNTSNNMDCTSKNSIVTHTGFRIGSRRSSDGNLKESFKSSDQRPMNTHPRDVASHSKRLRRRKTSFSKKKKIEKVDFVIEPTTHESEDQLEVKPESNIDNEEPKQEQLKPATELHKAKGKKKIDGRKTRTEQIHDNEAKYVYRFNIQYLIKFFKTTKLREEHFILLRKTPFSLLVDTLSENKIKRRDSIKYDDVVAEILQTYQIDGTTFEIAGKKLKLKRNDFKLIFGIACGHKKMNLVYGRKNEVAMVQRRKITESRMTSASIQKLIMKLLRSTNNEDVEDVVRLVCLLVCLLLLYSGTGTTIGWGFMQYLENIDEMRSYDWCGTAKQHLTKSIARNINQIDRVCGCVIILLYWMCEHAKIIKPNEKNPIPRFAKWNITHLGEQLAKSSLHDLKHIE